MAYAVQLVMMASNACMEHLNWAAYKMRCGRISSTRTWRLVPKITGSCKQGCSLQSQRIFYGVGDHVVVQRYAGLIVAGQKAAERSDAMHEALRYFSFLMFSTLDSLGAKLPALHS